MEIAQLISHDSSQLPQSTVMMLRKNLQHDTALDMRNQGKNGPLVNQKLTTSLGYIQSVGRSIRVEGGDRPRQPTGHPPQRRRLRTHRASTIRLRVKLDMPWAINITPCGIDRVGPLRQET